jgi:putative transposase
MPRRHRTGSGGIPHHVLNRASRRDTLFETAVEYQMFLRVLRDAKKRVPVRLAAFAVMPNHWHLILWPEHDKQLSQFMHWLTMTHTQRWHTSHGTTGTGPLYQGRYKAIPIQSDAHFLTAVRYVERNPVRGGLSKTPEGWRWSSAWFRHHGGDSELLDEWPVDVPDAWDWVVSGVEPAEQLERLRAAIKRGVPYGDHEWALEKAEALGMFRGRRPRGRPRLEEPRALY